MLWTQIQIVKKNVWAIVFNDVSYCRQQPPPPSTAPSAAPIKVPFIRKIKTWDEIVAEKKEEALAKAAMEYAARMQNGQDVPMEELDADKDNAAPEEGELPDE